MKIPFFSLELTSVEEAAVRKVIRSHWLTSGPNVSQFEEKVARLVHAKYAVATSSGTAGLHLALKALDIAPGNEVITTPYTMAATIEAILYCGAKPILADIDPDTLNIDPAQVESKVSRKTRGVVGVDIAGYPCDWQELRRIAREYRLCLIDDAAHSFGATYRGKPIGAWADATVFSFYPTKTITTGEGGMVVSDSQKIAAKVRTLSLHGMSSSGWKRHQGGNWRYDITDLGFKYNMPELSAAVGLAQLTRLSSLEKKRRRLERVYRKRLASLDEYLRLPYTTPDRESSRHLFIIRLNTDRWRISRDRLIFELEKAGIGCGVHYIPVYRFSYYRKMPGFNPWNYPHCEDTFRRVISLPFYPGLKANQVDYIGSTLEKLARKFTR